MTLIISTDASSSNPMGTPPLTKASNPKPIQTGYQKTYTLFFYKKVVYKKVVLFWPKPEKKIKKVLVLAPKN